MGQAAVLDRDDVGVLESRDHFNFSLESDALSIRGEGAAKQHLERELPASGYLSRFEDGSLGAAVDLVFDFISGCFWRLDN